MFFCKVVTNKRIRVRQGCTGCKKAFHTNCFTAYHCSNALGKNMQTLSKMVHESVKKRKRGNHSISKYVGNLDDFNLNKFMDK